MRYRKKLAALAGMALAGCWLAVNAAPAAAAGPCGRGYEWVDSHRIPDHGPKAGSIEVYYNPDMERNCAIVQAQASGERQFMSVDIALAGAKKSADADFGMRKHRAGPVYVSSGAGPASI
ncbi:hypothetical protein [[Actinomadura] parvosata]|uniref:hypothetical protein n=1 Tax=[Actinomadura] parvosata TaxID=1955412 RepID=UPI00164902B5